MKCLLFSLLLIGCNLTVSACDCLITPLKQHIQATPFLLTGTAIEILDGNTKEGREFRSLIYSMNKQDTVSHGYTAKLRIQQDFKGLFKTGDVIEIGSHYSNCELTFEVGKQYLLFLHKEKK